ncbi:hypothetical protein [Terracidiphilus gabretensis]|uniref:hypothetical protein n=1 Tax=Terracidiphilus gabretensis TaxID=1577687 RepID=UPI00071C1817|nr:hypothetical protein [Terracidiphilus gabretensis]
MKVVLRLLMVAALICVTPAVWAADLTGVWKGTFNFNDADVPTTLNLKVSGADVTGTIVGLPTSPEDIHDGKVAGDLVSFWVSTDYQGETYKLVFKGQIKGEQIDFTFGTEDGSWGTSLSVKRGDGAAPAPATPATPAATATTTALDVTGAYKGDWDMMGSQVTSTITLKSAGAVVTGTVQNGNATPIEIHDGKIDGDTVTFWINTEYQGQQYVLQYKGKITAGQISFEFGLADGSWGSALTGKKS